MGEATARELAKRGWQVAIMFAKNKAQADRVAGDINGLALQGDVAQDADCRRVAKAVLDKWGRIDALVNSAGTTKFVAHGDLEGLSAEDILGDLPHQRRRALPDDPRLRPCAEGSARLRGQRVVGGRASRHRLLGRLCRVEGGARHHEPLARARARAGSARERRRAGVRAHAVADRGARRRRRRRAGAALRRARAAQGRGRGAGRRRGDRLADRRRAARHRRDRSTSTAACTSLRLAEPKAIHH